jgi:uncharacterized membrane protein
MTPIFAPALTEEEKQFLFDQKSSEHFRIFSKAITWSYSVEAAKLVSLPSDQLLRAQGVLQGLLTARGIISTQATQGIQQSNQNTVLPFKNEK